MTASSICAVLDTDLFKRLKQDDEEFLEETMEAFDTRRQSLIQKIRDSNQQLITDYTKKYWEKVGDVFKVREDMIKKRYEELDKERQELVERYRDSLRSANLRRLDTIRLPGGEYVAEIYDKLDDVVKRKVEIYEHDLKTRHDDYYWKIRDSAFSMITFRDLIEAEIAHFKFYDNFYLEEFARTMGDTDSIFRELIKSLDDKFRACLACDVVKFGDKIDPEGFIESRGKKREELIKSRLDPKDDKRVEEHLVENLSVLKELEDCCLQCFGYGTISKEFFDFCGDDRHATK